MEPPSQRRPPMARRCSGATVASFGVGLVLLSLAAHSPPAAVELDSTTAMQPLGSALASRTRLSPFLRHASSKIPQHQPRASSITLPSQSRWRRGNDDAPTTSCTHTHSNKGNYRRFQSSLVPRALKEYREPAVSEWGDVKKVLIVGAEGLTLGTPTLETASYLIRELREGGLSVVVLSERETTANATLNTPDLIHRLPDELPEDYAARLSHVRVLSTNNSRSDLAAVLKEDDLDSFDLVFDFGSDSDLTRSVLDLCGKNKKKNSLKRYVYVSSIFVYGPFQRMLCDEEVSEVNLGKIDSEKHCWKEITHYQQKLKAEALLKNSDVSWTILRPGALINPGSSKSLENWYFQRHFYKSEIVIPGHGEFMLGLIHVEDLVAGCCAAAVSSKAEKNIYNLQAKDQGLTHNGLALATAKAANRTLDWYLDLIHYDPDHFVWVFEKGDHQFPVPVVGHAQGVAGKAEADFGFKPKFNVSEALADSWHHDFKYMVEAKEVGSFAYNMDQMIVENPHKCMDAEWQINFGTPPIKSTMLPLGRSDDYYDPGALDRWYDRDGSQPDFVDGGEPTGGRYQEPNCTDWDALFWD